MALINQWQDEIIAEEKAKFNIVGSDGNIIYKNVSLELSSEITQQGTPANAENINLIIDTVNSVETSISNIFENGLTTSGDITSSKTVQGETFKASNDIGTISISVVNNTYSWVGTTTPKLYANNPISVNGDVLDYRYSDSPIVESGGDSLSYWVRFANGVQICGGRKGFDNVAVNKAWGTLYDSGALTFNDFPKAFKYPPAVNIMTLGAYAGFIEKTIDSTTTNCNYFMICRASAGTYDYLLCYIAIGRWK